MAVAQKDHANPHAPRKFARHNSWPRFASGWPRRFPRFSVCRRVAALVLCSIANWWPQVPKVFSSRPSPSTANARRTNWMPAPLPAPVPLAGWQPGRTRAHPHPFGGGTTPARRHPPPEVSGRGHPQSGQSRARPSFRILPCPATAPLVGATQLAKTRPTRSVGAGRAGQAARVDRSDRGPTGGTRNRTAGTR